MKLKKRLEEIKKPEEIKKKRNHISWPQDRILGFTDGVFSFSVTLLVLNLISLSIPDGNYFFLPLLEKNAGVFISFSLTFFVIARFWMSHARLFAIIKEIDNTIVRLNIAHRRGNQLDFASLFENRLQILLQEKPVG